MDETEDLLLLHRQVCFRLAVASRSVIGLYTPVLAPLGLTHPQYLVMLALWQYAPVSQRELADLLHLEPATISPLLGRLEGSGLISRDRHPGDERIRTVSLTPAGTQLRRQAEHIPSTMLGMLDMDVAELQTLSDQLDDLIRRAERAGGAARSHDRSAD